MSTLHEYSLYLTESQRQRLMAALLEIGLYREQAQTAGEVVTAAMESQARGLAGNRGRLRCPTCGVTHGRHR
jgi:hypothetical protein